MSQLLNSRLGRYEIRSKLGEGGMGEVYLAQDTDLDRPVGLKILPASLTHDQDRLRRFRQEARAASKLNHPNVAHIYEIGEVNDCHFIAMEYVQGDTLRSWMSKVDYQLTKVIDIGAQVAAGLAAAHAQGVVHRDVKPENIVVQWDGLVKVLDFGLAKLETQSPQQSNDDASTLIQTSPGIVMGTVSYMSPEQARGIKLDSRTDVFSLGVVLYEMVARRRPFEGTTTSDVLAALLERTPQPLEQLKPEIPQELDRIVMKALEKDPEQRYQTIKDMALDLRKLKQRLEGHSESERSLPAVESGGTLSANHAQTTIAMLSDAVPQTGNIGQVRTTSSVEYVVSEIRQHKRGAAVLGLMVLAVLAVGAYGLNEFNRRKQAEAPPSFGAMTITKLTTTGKSKDAAISPDGKYVVYSVYDGGQASLWVRQLATNSNVQILSPVADIGYLGLTFSRDGNYIYYLRWTADTPASLSLFQIPVLGGTPRKIVTDVAGGVSFSPDGSHLVFGRISPDASETSLIVANADGIGERVLITRKLPDFFGGGSYIFPAWSPDGKVIACNIGSTDADGDYTSLVEVTVADGLQKRITSQRWASVGQVAWLRGGGSLVFVAKNSQSGSSSQIWHVPYPDGAARKITNDTNEYSGIDVTRDSNALVTAQITTLNNVWLTTPNGDASHAKQISSDNTGDIGLSWTLDNRIVYASRASGNVDLWSVEVDGTNPRQLTFDQHTDTSPAVTPDGRYIVFSSDRTGSFNVWRMDSDGGNPRQLTRGNFDDLASCSLDGRWVIYGSQSNGKPRLWRVSIDGGEPVQLTDYFSWGPVVSPDGKLIACLYYSDQPNDPQKIAILPSEGGPPKKLLELPSTAFGWLFRWSADGREISLVRQVNGVSNVWNISLDGGKPEQVTDLKTERITQFEWSHDRKQIALMRSAQMRDIVMISNFK